jgi:AraC family transcriptional activator of pobA
VHFLEALSSAIDTEWDHVRLLHAEPWAIEWAVPPRERDDYEIHYLELGSGDFRVGSQVYPITPGDIVVLHSIEGNSFRANSGPFRFIYLTFGFDCSGKSLKIQELSRALREDSFPIKPRDPSDICRILYALHGEITTKSTGHEFRMKLHLGSLAMAMLDAEHSETGADNISQPVISSTSYKLINKVIVYLQEHYNSSIRLETVGKIVNFHPRYLCTLFRQITGRTISEFICQFRIEKAKRLLLYTSLSITDIAQEIGYCNSQYFSKVFSRVEGTDPRTFRKTRRMI